MVYICLIYENFQNSAYISLNGYFLYRVSDYLENKFRDILIRRVVLFFLRGIAYSIIQEHNNNHKKSSVWCKTNHM